MDELLRDAGSGDFLQKAKAILEERWACIQKAGPSSPLARQLAPALIQEIWDALHSSTKTYRYVLPTQVLAKLADPALDCHSLQAQSGERGFDARTLCHELIVPFDRDNNRVLGGSPEPYVNNPLRVPAVTAQHGAQQRNKKEWARLVWILDYVENASAEEVQLVFDQILAHIFTMLAGTRIAYPVPSRISLSVALDLLEQFLAAKSGGYRLQIVVTALLQVVGRQFSLYDDVRSRHVNAADAGGWAGDIECFRGGRLILAVEVKDRGLALGDLSNKVVTIRERGVREFLALVKGVIPKDDKAARFIESQFAGGHNIYTLEFWEFIKPILVLLGEEGRTEFVHGVGPILDSFGEFEHRRAWAEVLGKVYH